MKRRLISKLKRHRSDALENPNLPDSVYSANNPEAEYIRKTLEYISENLFRD